VSGIIDEMCPSVSDCSLAVGDRVVVYPTSDEELKETGSVQCETRSFHHHCVTKADILRNFDKSLILMSGSPAMSLLNKPNYKRAFIPTEFDCLSLH